MIALRVDLAINPIKCAHLPWSAKERKLSVEWVDLVRGPYNCVHLVCHGLGMRAISGMSASSQRAL